MIINLLSNPRNVSTALMYAFAQREDCAVLDEPFYAYYLSTSGEDHPMRPEILLSQPTGFDGVVNEIQTLSQSTPHLFLKNMAHHLRAGDWSFSKSCFNIIFIRHPREVLASFYKVIENPTLNDIAIRDQFEWLEYFKAHHIPYCILDSAELLDNVPAMLNLLCRTAGLDYTDDMTSWSSGPKPYDGIWAPHWYGNVHKSTGFKKRGHYGQNPLPEKLHGVLNKAMEYYKVLHAERLRLV